MFTGHVTHRKLIGESSIRVSGSPGYRIQASAKSTDGRGPAQIEIDLVKSARACFLIGIAYDGQEELVQSSLESLELAA